MSFKLSAKIKYNDKKIVVTAANVGTPDEDTLTQYTLTTFRSDGVMLSRPTGLTVITRYQHMVTDADSDGEYNDSNYIARADVNFGLEVHSAGVKQAGGSYFTNADIVHGSNTISGLFAATGIYTPSAANKLNDIPILIEEGESVFHGRITDVSSKNLISYTGDSYNLPNAQTTNFAGDLLYVYSGNGSGTYATITATGAGTSFYVDKNFSGYNTGLFKIMPRTTVTGNSAWADTYTVSNLYTDKVIPTGLGHISATSISLLSGINTSDPLGFTPTLNPYVQSITNYGGMLINVVRTDGWSKDITVGDIVTYRHNSTPTVLDGYAVVYATGAITSTDAQLYVYPSGSISTVAGYTGGSIHRHNRGKLLIYPDFSDNIILSISSASSTLAIDTIETPSARLEVTANDYDSAFSTVGDTSHFHIGPIVVSNGEVINNEDLWFSGSLYNSDPTQVAADKSWSGYATKDSSASEHFQGEYYKRGVFVGTYSQSFLSAEMLTLSAKVKYGSATVANIISIPVQPSV